MAVDPEHTQSAAAVRFDWGLTGAGAIATGCAAAVVVDVLSFTTTVSVGMDLGAEVLPFPWREGAEEYAASHHAACAVGRRAAGPDEVSLSPVTWRLARPSRVVLPSPNGSTIAFALSETVPEVAAGTLRNWAAVGAWLATVTGPVCVVAAGEKWPDDSLRPALEDLLGAGAVLAGLVAARGGSTDGWSPEARLALHAWQSTSDVATTVRDSASGRELITRGFSEDVEIALERADSGDASPWLPLLHDRTTFRRVGVK